MGESRELRLGDVAEIVMGQSPPGETCNAEGVGVPLLNGPTEFGSHHPTPVQFTTDARKRAVPGDVLFCVRGSTTGRMNWADREYAIGRGVAAIRHEKYPELQPFVRAVIEYELHGLLTQATGSTFPNVSAAQLASVPWPPLLLSEQRAIAHILGTLDDKIELNRKMNQTLEAIARAIFKSWFVDFDPVIDNALAARKPIPEKFAERLPAGKAGAARRTQLTQGKSSLPENIRRLFPDEFQDSELGPIPKGWEAGQLGNLVNFLSGYAFKSRDWRDKGVPVVKIGSIKPGIIDLGTVSYVSEQVATQAERYRLSSADLLIGMTGYVGEVGLVPPTDNPPLLNQRVGKFVLEKSGTESLGFVYCLTRRSQFKAEVEAKSHGTAQANVSAKGILSIAVVLPPRPLRGLFNRSCKPILDGMLDNWAKSRSLAALRDALLPKLISKEMQVIMQRYS